jgi:DNA-binding MarR family transcriptional regulator
VEIINSTTLAEEAIRLVRLLFLVGRDKNLGLHGNKLHFHVLYVLCNHPPPGPSMSQLAEDLLVSPQQLSRLISGMEEAGLVEREHDPANRRRVYVRALPAGLADMENALADMMAWIARELAPFSAEDMQRLHECFTFIGRLLEKGIRKYTP